MKKKFNKGFMLVETLVVTSFVAGVLIFMYIQFSNLNNKYNESYEYNTVEGLYSLENIRDYIESEEESGALESIIEALSSNSIIDIKDCSLFTNKKYCKKLFDLENLKNIYAIKTHSSYGQDISENLKKFMNKIGSIEEELGYRLIAEFNDETFATIRFGE